MLAGAVERLVRLHRVLPGTRAVVVAAGDRGLHAALALSEAGARVGAVADLREAGAPLLTRAVSSRVPEVLNGWTAVAATGRGRVRAVTLAPVASTLPGAGPMPRRELPCELLVVSGPHVPALGLVAQAGARIAYDDLLGLVLRGPLPPAVTLAGQLAGEGGTRAAGSSGERAALIALRALGRGGADTERRIRELALRLTGETPEREAVPPADGGDRRWGRTYLCPCRDVTGEELSREIGRHRIDVVSEVAPRTRAGTGPCAGRLCESALARLLARETGTRASQAGRPLTAVPLTAVPLGALAAAAREWTLPSHALGAGAPEDAGEESAGGESGALCGNRSSAAGRAVEVAVLGAGTLGLAVALALRRAGAERVVLLGRRQDELLAAPVLSFGHPDPEARLLLEDAMDRWLHLGGELGEPLRVRRWSGPAIGPGSRGAADAGGTIRVEPALVADAYARAARRAGVELPASGGGSLAIELGDGGVRSLVAAGERLVPSITVVAGAAGLRMLDDAGCLGEGAIELPARPIELPVCLTEPVGDFLSAKSVELVSVSHALSVHSIAHDELGIYAHPAHARARPPASWIQAVGSLAARVLALRPELRGVRVRRAASRACDVPLPGRGPSCGAVGGGELLAAIGWGAQELAAVPAISAALARTIVRTG
jgi:glycine/D-amino acid oxidase-like deaminating enzyme